MSYRNFSSFFVLFLTVVFSAGCSGSSQFTEKMTANPFVAELYGDTTKNLSISSEPGSHIAWMGFDWLADYRFFNIEQVSISGRVISSPTAGPTAVFSDISVDPSGGTSSGTSGNTATSQLLVRIKYSPLQAITADDRPHKAYLLVVYDRPETGVLRIELNGYTQGVCDESTGEECNFTDASGLTPRTYRLVDDRFELYVCHPDITVNNLANVSDKPNTRRDEVPISDDFVFYMSGDNTEIHIVRDDNSDLLPTVPEFDIPVPLPELGDNFTLRVGLRNPQNVECDVDTTSGGFNCTGVGLNITNMPGIVLSPFVVSTDSETPTSNQCQQDFGSISGSPGINGDQMTVVAWGVLQSTPLNAIGNDTFVDALIVAVLPLQRRVQ